jgi:TetR/AcrR family transcriptional regulator, cholesterol catabolism regulator
MPDKKRSETPGSQLSRRRKSAQAKDKASYSAQREKIIASAADAFRAEGYDRTTLSDIAKRAGTDRASLYYYVGSKEELFQEVTSGMLERNLTAAEEIATRDIGAREKLELIIAYHMAEHDLPQMSVLIEEMPRVADARTTWSRDVIAKMKRYESVVVTILEEGIADGTIRGDVPPRLAMNAIFGMLNWTHRWFRADGQYNAAAVAAAFTAIALDGLSKADGHQRRSRPSRARARQGAAASR